MGWCELGEHESRGCLDEDRSRLNTTTQGPPLTAEDRSPVRPLVARRPRDPKRRVKRPELRLSRALERPPLAEVYWLCAVHDPDLALCRRLRRPGPDESLGEPPVEVGGARVIDRRRFPSRERARRQRNICLRPGPAYRHAASTRARARPRARGYDSISRRGSFLRAQMRICARAPFARETPLTARHTSWAYWGSSTTLAGVTRPAGHETGRQKVGSHARRGRAGSSDS